VTVPVDPQVPPSAADSRKSPSGAAVRGLQQDYWPLPVLRAVPAAVVALVVTFSAEHSSRFGLIAFAVLALATGSLVALILRRRLMRSGVRGILTAQAAVSLVLGVAALVLADRGVTAFIVVVAVWAALTGALELYAGLRERRRHPASGDWTTSGALTLVLAIALLVVGPDFAQEFVGPDGVDRVLDSSVVAVGLFGAYSAIIAVYLLVAGLSAKWGTTGRPDAPPAAESTTDAAKGDLP
jgi:uncharacterized membrane protein HdeD (DUF308 family)